MERAEAEAIYEQGKDVVVAVLLRMDEQIQRSEKRVEQQDQRIAQLERLVKRSSRNSSQPPSADPPGSPPRRSKGPSGRAQGAQHGHEGKGRELLPTSAVDEVVVILQRVADALAAPDADLLERVRASKTLNMDETGWRTAGARRALWGAFTDRHAVLRVRANRHEEHAKELLADTKAIVTSDRWWAYSHLPLRRRQVCWAHLQRDFKAHAEGLGAEQQFGEEGLRVCQELFWSWEICQHTRDRSELGRRIRALRRACKPILRSYAGKQARYKYTRGMARNLLKVWPALWAFADHNGIEPTDNHAERALRGAVIYRKLSLGSQSDEGERRIERLLSVHTTCRLQSRPLLPDRRLHGTLPRRPRATAGLTTPGH